MNHFRDGTRNIGTLNPGGLNPFQKTYFDVVCALILLYEFYVAVRFFPKYK